MKTRLPRIYVDTSTVGGVFDEEFAVDSRRLFAMARRGDLQLLVSDIVLRELERAPVAVRAVLTDMPREAIELVVADEEVFELADAYLRDEIVGPQWADDAAHVAAATVARADAIVSWNFKHIVRLEKMKAYNRVNIIQGYGLLTIITPREVSNDEDDRAES